MIDYTHLQNLPKTHPELFKKPYLQAMPVQTLSDIGVKASQEALSLDYICIRAHSASGFTSQPGLWIAPQDLDSINELILAVEAERDAVIAKAQGRATSQVQRKQAANQISAIATLAHLTTMTSKEVRNALPSDILSHYALKPEAPAEYLALKLAPSWRGQSITSSKVNFTVDGFVVCAATKTMCSALLAQDEDRYLAALEARLVDLQQQGDSLFSKWNVTRPSWFTAEELQSWARDAVNGNYSEHPLLSLKEVRAIFKRKTSTEFNGRATTGGASPLTAAQLLWDTEELTDGSVHAYLSSVLKQSLQEQVQSCMDQFIAENPFTPEVLDNEFSRDEWNEFLVQAYTDALPAKFDASRASLAAQVQVSKQLAGRHLELTARRCRRELPSSLKDFYPLARAMKREITFIYGPTNSGKTHKALEYLREAKSGAYLGPLRLLALEVFERMNDAGVPTSLVTGELVQEVEGAMHTSATIEMMDISKALDVMVVDEVQMLSDDDRGAAWLAAVLGAPAKHLVLLGSASALPAVRMLAKFTGESLNTVSLERLTPLKVAQQPIAMKDAVKGSAFIVFSRQAALSLASHLREKSNRRVSVVYGALSPEVRSEQARQFRDGESDYLVATDAIGMGLNLPIHTVIFTATSKWNGRDEVRLAHSLTCQIAGRAGRFGLQESGTVSAFNAYDLKYVRKMLGTPIDALEPPYFAGLNLEVAQSISRHLHTQSLSQIIAFFMQAMTIEDWAKPHCTEDQQLLAGFLDHLNLDLAYKLLLSNAPAIDKGVLNDNFKAMVTCIQGDVPETLRMFDISIERHPLAMMEGEVKDVTLYSWFHYRFPLLFPRIKEAQDLLFRLNAAITRALSAAPGRHCTGCGRSVPWDHAFGMCEACFKSRSHGRNEYGW